MFYQRAAELLLSKRNEEWQRYQAELRRAMRQPAFAEAVRRRNALAPLAARGERVPEYESAKSACIALEEQFGVTPPRASCPVCGDTGFDGANPCFCLKQSVNDLIAESTLSELPPESFDRADFGLFGEENRKRYEKIYSEARRVSEAPERSDPCVFVYCGKTGTGKTYLAKCIEGTLLERRRTVIALSAYGFFDLLSGLYRSEDKRVIMSALSDSDALIVDDLGCEACGEYAKNIFVSLLSVRTEKRKLTVFTTNLMPENIKNTYGDRVYSRLFDKNLAIAHKLDGRDARKR